MRPKVSIILPCYNVEKYIARSIESVLAQSYSNFELLVIIDGSLDKSKEIAESFVDDRICIFCKENGGLSDARNYGLDRANGDYIYFMDSDDWLAPNLLADNLKIVEEEGLDVIIFGYIQDNENKEGKIENSYLVSPQDQSIERGDEYILITPNLLGLMGYAWNKIYKKSFLKKNQLHFEKNISLVEDILFNTQVFQKTRILRFNSGGYYHYLNRPIPSLTKQFHFNSFDLIKRKTISLDSFLSQWKVVNEKAILSISLIQGIRHCVHCLFSFNCLLSFREKTNYVKKMVNDALTMQLISYYKPISLKDRLYKFLINRKLAYVIALFAQYAK